MIKSIFFVLGLLTCCSSLIAQERVWVVFTDKGEQITERLSNPHTFLSAEALARRNAQGLAIDATDLPVSSAYLTSLQQYPLQILSTSRWLNAAAVALTPNLKEELADLCFVKEIRPMGQLVTTGYSADTPVTTIQNSPITRPQANVFDYGKANVQNTMIRVPELHNKGFTGKGVRVAIFDSGFDGVDQISVFDSIRANGQIIATYDFVDGDSNVYGDHSHGTQVLSTIAANQPGEMVGTAPHASFVLCRTEISGTETRQEEYNWVAAMEWVDSIGVDIIHTSLGYSEFDSEAESYTYEDMDGNTAITTRAADLAAKKGIIVTVSAGNEGNAQWHYITAPCDGDSVICVGSVDRFNKRSGFSSFGPTSDGRIKPDVVAMGSQTIVASPRGYTHPSFGTSFSGPLVAGLVACVRQAHPDRPHMDIVQAIRMSGDQYSMPDAEYGYGIANAARADSLLSLDTELGALVMESVEKPQRGKVAQKSSNTVVLTDNPQTQLSRKKNILTIQTPAASIDDIQLMRGKQTLTLDPKDVTVSGGQATFNITYLLPGDYYIRVKTDQFEENVAFSK